MKKITILLQNGILLFALAFLFSFGSLPAEAQTVAPSKIAMITSDKFTDAKLGIARLRTAVGVLEREFVPVEAELTQMASRLQLLQTEIRNPIVDQATKSKKYEEAQKLERDIKFKQKMQKRCLTGAKEP